MAIVALANYRKKKRLTQKQLGKLLGVSDAAVARWESGKREPRLKDCQHIAKVTGIPIGLLRNVPVEQLRRKRYARA